jgi:hypothetical protein
MQKIMERKIKWGPKVKDQKDQQMVQLFWETGCVYNVHVLERSRITILNKDKNLVRRVEIIPVLQIVFIITIDPCMNYL